MATMVHEEDAIQVQNIEELRRYVAETLGSFEMLEVNQCHFTEQLLYRGDTPCGVHFRLFGPRAVCLSAIWETDRNSIHFYGSCGRRVHRTVLASAAAIKIWRSHAAETG
jgi:hypothetical protein